MTLGFGLISVYREDVMHELSIALRIVEALDKELANEADDLIVAAVNIQIGALTGLVPEALQFSWDLATENTRLQGSELQIDWVDAAGFCPECPRTAK